MSDHIKIDFKSSISKEQLNQLITLPPRKRRQLLGGLGRELKRQSIRNLRAQQDVDGKPWAPRKHQGVKTKGRKLLRHINRQVAANVLTGEFVEVSFRGAVALQQQEGITQVMTGGRMRESMTDNQKKKQNDPATKKQAKALRDENYKIRVKGTKKWRKPSLKWIQENLTQKKAGLILAHLRGVERKKSWITRVPGRPFLGATQAQINTFVNKVFDNTINSRV